MSQPLSDTLARQVTMPPVASEYAGQVDALYLALLGLSGLLVMILLVWVAYSALRFRASAAPSRKTASSRNTMPSKGRFALLSKYGELGFAVLLLCCFMGFFVWGAALYLNAYSDQRDMLTIHVIGKQWMWKVQHGNGAREINTLHVPVDQPVRLQLTSQDVIHSFSVPALRLKRDAVPERYTQVSFTANKIGSYYLFCAEYCGTDHAKMQGRVEVVSREDYRQWLVDNAQHQALAAVGKSLFEAYQCGACHHSGDDAAPALSGLAGREVALASGERVIADDNYLRRAIMRPQAQKVAGYPSSMPSYEGQISETELLQILAYIKALPARQQEETQ